MRYELLIVHNFLERFSNVCRKTNNKAIISTNHNKSKQYDETIRVPRNHLLLAQSAGKSHVQSDIGSGFVSDWLKNWREIFNPITKRWNRNLVLNYFQQSFENCSHTEDNQSISPRLGKQSQVVVRTGWEPSKTTLQGRSVRFWRCTHSKNVSVDEGAPNYGALGACPPPENFDI